MSLCGGMIENFDHVPAEIFDQYLISYNSFYQKPAETLHNPDLVIRIGKK